MKKIIVFFILVLLVVFIMGVFVAAEDTGISTNGDTIDMSTILDRVIEWWDLNGDKVIGFVSLAATGIITGLFKNVKKCILELLGKNGTLLNATQSSSGLLNDLIGGYNSQVDEIKALKLKNYELEKQNVEILEGIELMKKEISHIAHILTTAYTNNKALPQGVRDMINLECAECMKEAGIGISANEVITDETKDENEG